MRPPEEAGVQEVRDLPVGRRGRRLRGRDGRVRRRAGQEAAEEVRGGIDRAVRVLAEPREEAGEVRRLCGELGGGAEPRRGGARPAPSRLAAEPRPPGMFAKWFELRPIRAVWWVTMLLRMYLL